jgi:ABC-2 type transport system ATP-binding protein
MRTAGQVGEDVEIRQADMEDVFLEVMNRQQTASGALA